MKRLAIGFIGGLVAPYLFGCLWGLFWNPKIANLSKNHIPLRKEGHWHEEIDAKTGFLYAAPGYCGVEVDCE